MGAAMQASAPQYSQTYGTANVYNPKSGNTTVNYSGYTTTYNPAATAAAQANASAAINSQMMSNMALVDAQKERAIGTNKGIFGRTTLFPGNAVDGRLIFEGSRIADGEVIVTVRVGGEEHHFVFIAQKDQ